MQVIFMEDDFLSGLALNVRFRGGVSAEALGKISCIVTVRTCADKMRSIYD